MKLATVVTVTVVPLLLAILVAPAARAHDGQHQQATTAHATQVTSARRWATDAPLRAGMAQIRAAVDALGHYEHGHMGPEQAVVLASRIQGQVAYVVANCKLEPQADAALHGVIAELGVAAQALKVDPANLAVIASMRHALASYSRQFNDPDMAAAAEPEEAR